MVTTRAGSRESTPAASVRGGRTSTRRASAAPSEVGTPSSRTRTRKSGPQTARTGHTSHAYGVGSQATASRVAARTSQGFASALENELFEQDELDPVPEASTLLSPVVEDGQPWRSPERHSSRESTPASKVSSSFSMSPTDLRAEGFSKSFSEKREAGLRDQVHVHFRDIPEQIPNINIAPVQQGPTVQERTNAVLATLGDITTAFVAGAKIFINDYWKHLLGLLFCLAFGSLLATYGLPTIDRLLPSGSISRPNHPYNGDTTTTVISYLPNPSPDTLLTNKLRHLESRVTFLEDELSHIKSLPAGSNAATNKPFNHLSAALGATIIPGFTSPTKRSVSSLLIPLSKLWTPPGMKGPLTALMPWSEPGECWCTPAERASLAVRAPYPLRPTAVTIEHVTSNMLSDSGHDLSTAPGVVEVWARTGISTSLFTSPDNTEETECQGAAPEPKGWTCLTRMEMDSHAFGQEMGRWTVDFHGRDGDFIEAAQDYAFVVLQNRGNAKATCLYRVLMHGEKV